MEASGERTPASLCNVEVLTAALQSKICQGETILNVNQAKVKIDEKGT